MPGSPHSERPTVLECGHRIEAELRVIATQGGGGSGSTMHTCCLIIFVALTDLQTEIKYHG